MGVVKCQSCGSDVQVPGNKGMPCLIAALIAIFAIPVIVGIIGLLAAIAIPSFFRARDNAGEAVCRSNLAQIEAGKQEWAAGMVITESGAVDTNAVNLILGVDWKGECPQGGTYSYNQLGEEPSCSYHDMTVGGTE